MEEYSLKLDCDDTTTISNALTALEANECQKATSCNEETESNVNDCYKPYLIVMMHHDYCPEDKLPTGVEKLFHTYEVYLPHIDISHVTDDCL